MGRSEPSCHMAEGSHRSGVIARPARPRSSRLPREPLSQRGITATREGVSTRTRLNAAEPTLGNLPRTASTVRTVLICNLLLHHTCDRNDQPLIWYRRGAA